MCAMSVAGAMVREQLAKILASRHFARTTRLSRLLQFIVDETLAGRAAELKEYPIAIAVFDKPETFDPRLDAIVRVQAREMRSRLDAYYNDEGSDEGWADEMVIRCEAGTYAPRFDVRQTAPRPHAQTEFWNARIDALQALLARKAAR
jgi:hypothetical protein